MYKAKAYLRTDCPYSFKFLLFMSEAGLLDHIDIVECDPQGSAFAATKARLAQATGRAVTFPIVEVEAGRYQSDSDALIQHYAAAHGVDRSALAALHFYLNGILPQLEALHRAPADHSQPP